MVTLKFVANVKQLDVAVKRQILLPLLSACPMLVAFIADSIRCFTETASFSTVATVLKLRRNRGISMQKISSLNMKVYSPFMHTIIVFRLTVKIFGLVASIPSKIDRMTKFFFETWTNTIQVLEHRRDKPPHFNSAVRFAFFYCTEMYSLFCLCAIANMVK